MTGEGRRHSQIRGSYPLSYFVILLSIVLIIFVVPVAVLATDDSRADVIDGSVRNSHPNVNQSNKNSNKHATNVRAASFEVPREIASWTTASPDPSSTILSTFRSIDSKRCADRAVAEISEHCSTLNDDFMARLVLTITNCHLLETGRSAIPCSSTESISLCLSRLSPKRMDETSMNNEDKIEAMDNKNTMHHDAPTNAFVSYTTFKARAYEICYAASLRSFHLQTTTLVTSLVSGAVSVSEGMKESVALQRQLSDDVRDSVKEVRATRGIVKRTEEAVSDLAIAENKRAETSQKRFNDLQLQTSNVMEQLRNVHVLSETTLNTARESVSLTSTMMDEQKLVVDSMSQINMKIGETSNEITQMRAAASAAGSQLRDASLVLSSLQQQVSNADTSTQHLITLTSTVSSAIADTAQRLDDAGVRLDQIDYLLKVVSELQSKMTGDIDFVRGILFYGIAIIFAILLTIIQRTIAARGWLIIVLVCGWLVETLLRHIHTCHLSSMFGSRWCVGPVLGGMVVMEDQILLLRYIQIILLIITALYHFFSYRDYPSLTFSKVNALLDDQQLVLVHLEDIKRILEKDDEKEKEKEKASKPWSSHVYGTSPGGESAPPLISTRPSRHSTIRSLGNGDDGESEGSKGSHHYGTRSRVRLTTGA